MPSPLYITHAPLINFQPNLSQQQSQSQEQSSTLQQSINQAVNLIEQRYGEREAARAKEMLEELEQSHDKWHNVKKAAAYFLDLGREAFLAVLPTLSQLLVRPH
jgi:hypothetical protein